MDLAETFRDTLRRIETTREGLRDWLLSRPVDNPEVRVLQQKPFCVAVSSTLTRRPGGLLAHTYNFRRQYEVLAAAVVQLPLDKLPAMFQQVVEVGYLKSGPAAGIRFHAAVRETIKTLAQELASGKG